MWRPSTLRSHTINGFLKNTRKVFFLIAYIFESKREGAFFEKDTNQRIPALFGTQKFSFKQPPMLLFPVSLVCFHCDVSTFMTPSVGTVNNKWRKVRNQQVTE